MPIQLDFVLRRLAEMAEADPTLRDRQPWKAAHERDFAWLAARGQHYAGDDTDVKMLMGRHRRGVRGHDGRRSTRRRFSTPS